MSNTGYIINPHLIQVFTTGPNSGSMVTSSFNIDFNTSSSFTSSIICGTEYNYKIYDVNNCISPGTCYIPSFVNIDINNCDVYDYKYNITYATNSPISESIDGVLMYSLNSNFSGETIQQIIISTGSLNSITVDISEDLINLPLNKYTPIYFRIWNNCNFSGSYITSSYTNSGPIFCLI